MPDKRTRGRKRRTNGVTIPVGIRLTADEWNCYETRAVAANISVSEWFRRAAKEKHERDTITVE